MRRDAPEIMRRFSECAGDKTYSLCKRFVPRCPRLNKVYRAGSTCWRVRPVLVCSASRLPELEKEKSLELKKKALKLFQTQVSWSQRVR